MLSKKMSMHELTDEEDQAKRYSYPSAFDDYNVRENSTKFHHLGNRNPIWILHIVCSSFPSSSFVCLVKQHCWYVENSPKFHRKLIFSQKWDPMRWNSSIHSKDLIQGKNKSKTVGHVTSEERKILEDGRPLWPSWVTWQYWLIWWCFSILHPNWSNGFPTWAFTLSFGS